MAKYDKQTRLRAYRSYAARMTFDHLKESFISDMHLKNEQTGR